MKCTRRRALWSSGLILAGCLAASAHGQNLVLEGGTVHSLAGEPTVSHVVISDGRIVAVGTDVEIPAETQRLDVTGKHVYPGLFDALGTLGLVEISAISATVDSTELGRFNPHLSAATAVHPASEVVGVTRANGITHAITAPRSRGGVISGQAALIHLDGWTIEEMAMDPGIAMVVQWPGIQTRVFDRSTFTRRSVAYKDAEETANEARNELRDWLDAARHYAQATAAANPRAERNLALEALVEVVEGRQPVIMQTSAARDIESAIEFAEEQGLKIVVAGAREAWKVKDLLAEKGIPVILGRTLSLPQEDDAPYDRPFRTAGELHEAGVKIAFATGAGGGFGPGGPHSSRTLPYECAQAVAYGLPHEAALRAVTVNAAEMLGVGDQLGTIEAGKIANLMVTDGDPLEITTQILELVIQGRVVSTANRHRSLYERYRKRPQAP